MIWPWSGGCKPDMPSFEKMYGKKGSIISAVDVILGLGLLGKMESLRPEGATGWIDTNYENKARAAVDMLRRNDFVYLHVEAVDECGHLGDLPNKMKAIEDVRRAPDQDLPRRVQEGSQRRAARDGAARPPGAGEAAQAHPRSRALHGVRRGREQRRLR
jgi:2,3-bisphosphoglycerate-independent phosphoglycerate mutase